MIQKTGSIHVYFQRNKGHLAGVILCSILAGMGETMWAFVFQKIGELPGDMTKAAILRLAGILLFTVFYYAVSQNACAYFRRTFLKRINIQLKRDVFDAVLDQDMIQFTSNNSGMYLSILNNDVTNLENNYFAKIPEIIQQSFVFLGCLAVLCYYDGRVAGMVLLTVWIPVAVPFLFGNVISEAEGRFYRNLEQYTGKLKDFFGGFEVIQCFQIGKETEELFGSCVKDVEESRYHSRFCASSGEVFALSLTYGTLFFQILFCAWMAAKGKISANAMLSILYLLSSINNPVQNAVQAFLSVKSARPNVEKVEKLLAKPEKRTHPSVDRK